MTPVSHVLYETCYTLPLLSKHTSQPEQYSPLKFTKEPELTHKRQQARTRGTAMR